MHTAATGPRPAETIRSYLIEEGPTHVPFHNLLTSWGLPPDPGVEARQLLISDLADVGVCVDRPLIDLAPEDEVGLSLRKPSQPSIPALPYVGPAPTPAAPN